MTTTFESLVPGTLTYQDGLLAIVTTLEDVLDYLDKAALPPELREITTGIRTILIGLGVPEDTESSFAQIVISPRSPQEAAAKAVKVFKVVVGLTASTCRKAAVKDPLKAIKLRKLQEHLDEQSIVFERYVWLGTTKAS